MGLVFLIIWALLFLWRKDARKEMTIMSIIFGIAGLLVEPTYIKDWWTPLTFTNTLIGFEDFLFGFVVGGIAAIIYSYMFNKKIKIKKKTKKIEFKRNLNFALFGLIFAGLFFGSFYLLKLNTLYSSLIAFIIGILIIWIKRKDLIKNSILSGVLLLFIASIVYTITEFIFPGWIIAFWSFKNIPNIILFNIPLDDFIWYFLAGAFIGPLYEYWQEGKLINKK
tara:strand:+ start:1025 stop:1693 length:669 start_codon:yes stop_codon:yes gene_type:complete